MASTFRRLSVAILLAGLLLGGCQTVQAPPAQPGLTAAQVAVLRTEGFTHTDAGWEFGFADRLLFPTDGRQLDVNQQRIIERITHALLGADIDGARIEGHTDSTGSQAHNDALSVERAKVVADAMVDAGMPIGGLRVEGLGARYPVASNRSANGKQENRRVVIIVSD